MANLPTSHSLLDIAESWVKPPVEHDESFTFIEK
jgi:hypothetical protein